MVERNDRMLGESPAFLSLMERVSQVAPLTRSVLSIGERGTGKELVAARLHYLSERWGQPYLTLNCAALTSGLLDSELFGHDQGAFSGASRRHQGFLERADGGTLFLDELATAPMAVQEKLLRVLEYGTFYRVGGSTEVSVDVRIVAATNLDLRVAAAEDRFRADLLDRLAFDVLTLPPLRARPEDIVLLAEHFALGITRELGREYFAGFAPQALAALQAYGWPGNVRELKNAVERSVYRWADAETPLEAVIIDPFESVHAPTSPADGPALTTGVLRPTAACGPTSDGVGSAGGGWEEFKASGRDLKAYLAAQEQALLRAALAQARHNQRTAAEALGVTYDQVRALLRKHKLNKTNI